MGDFKPLLNINGFAMIRLAVQGALDGGVSRVCVVTGREHERVRDALEGIDGAVDPFPGQGRWPSVSFVHNPAFADTDMLHSLKLGLRSLPEDVDALFVLPADVAAVSPRTFGALSARAAQDSALIFRPEFQAVGGHPLLVKASCFNTILAFDGDGGLRKALDPLRVEPVAVEDEGITLDADESADFAVLAAYARATKGVSSSITGKLLDEFETPTHIRSHGRAVSELALRMVRRLNARGCCLDSELCRSAAALHDMNRLEEHHSQVAAAHLRTCGYDAVARVVGDHDNTQGFDTTVFSESLIVFIADKLVKESHLVTLEERYEPALRRFSAETPIGQRIRQDKAWCQAMLTRYEELTGDTLQ
jgi:CTP:molybdopterin cytidylyltransferase MocA